MSPFSYLANIHKCPTFSATLSFTEAASREVSRRAFPRVAMPTDFVIAMLVDCIDEHNIVYQAGTMQAQSLCGRQWPRLVHEEKPRISQASILMIRRISAVKITKELQLRSAATTYLHIVLRSKLYLDIP